jgi:homoserine kinase type II
MAFLTPLELSDARELASGFGLDVVAIEPLAAGSVNSNFRLTEANGRAYFARLYEEQGTRGAAAELALLRELAAAGVPTVEPLLFPDGRSLAEHAGKPFAVFPWKEGEILCQGRVTREACTRLGGALARVHLASAVLSAIPEGRFGVSDLRLRLDRIEREASGRFTADVARIRERLSEYTARRDPAIPAGLIHGDLFRDNVLWQNETLAALLDFESASQGPFVYDVMVTVLAWCYGERFEPSLVQALLAGYHAVRPLSSSELRSLPVEGAIGALRFATTRITDYAMRAPPGRPPVRDYRRFLARLAELERGALSEAIAELARG